MGGGGGMGDGGGGMGSPSRTTRKWEWLKALQLLEWRGSLWWLDDKCLGGTEKVYRNRRKWWKLAFERGYDPKWGR